MLSAVNANSKEQLEELSLCLKKTKECNVVATLRQYAESASGEMQQVTIQELATVSRNMINVDGGLVYAEISEKEGSINDIRKIREMWRAVLNRGTNQFLRGNANDYGITIDLICTELENEKVYVVSFFNPQFMAAEDHGISIATPLDQFMFGIESLSLAEIEYEEEQRAEQERKSGNGYGYTYTDMDEEYEEEEDDNEYTSSEDYISNEDRISPVKD